MTSIHPAVTVTNIRNVIPIVLEMENAQYTSWAELFKIHCRACQVIDHILPTTATSASKESDAATTDKTTDWKRLDSIVLQWIYGTISNDLLHTILKPDSTAAEAWKSLANIFQDNQNSRALYLENKFSNTRLNDFPNISAYCQALKMLSDQLANVNAPISNQRLVLQLIAGLNEQFDGVAMLLQQTSPLPDFTVARSKLILEETRKANQTTPPEAALHATTNSPTAYHPVATHPPATVPSTPPHSDHFGRGYSDPSYSQNRAPYTPRGRGRGGRGRGRGCSRGRTPSPFYNQWPAPRQSYYPPPWYAPPCPYPSVPTPTTPSRAPGILGAGPPQSYAASHYSYTPTDIEQAMHTMTLNPDQQWY